ncbi:MAG: TetR/AcrR family transcriptional regulator [Desulfobacterales bacterium]|nr:TetR/AcrR family transcriptional regulator [Desulfobacterales bacterium]
MRIKDDMKQAALFEATVKLVNEIGFSASSVSKIAKEAGVSPATIYVYHKNKEELIVSTYIDIKQDMSRAVLEGFDPTLPIRDIFQNVWLNMFAYISEYRNYVQFTEQFASSPYNELVNHQEIEKYFKPVIAVLQRGISQKIIKDVDFDILATFIFYPILTLSNARLCRTVKLNDAMIEKAFTLAWDAIKL